LCADFPFPFTGCAAPAANRIGPVPLLPLATCSLRTRRAALVSKLSQRWLLRHEKGMWMGIISQAPNPTQARRSANRQKMHLRLLTAGGTTYRVVTLRPGCKVRFSTNFFHQTWHIVTSQRGARLLARLLWGLAFQRQAGTLLLIHGDHLLPTPFEGERSDPFLLVPAGLTPLNPSALRELKGRLARLGPPDRTIRWHTFGLDLALRSGPGGRAAAAAERERCGRQENRQLGRQERMGRLGGFIVYSAPAPILRQQALLVHDLRVRKGSSATEMDYHFLAQESSEDSWYGGGEVQIFADYLDRVGAATQARHELLPNPNSPVLSDTMQEVISRRRDQIKARRAARHEQRPAKHLPGAAPAAGEAR
jgi:hypothetical protein